jgi:hypothetical protein
MVMPCSRSARRPSGEQREVDAAVGPRGSSWASWSGEDRAGVEEQAPISVDLPSSTLTGRRQAEQVH